MSPSPSPSPGWSKNKRTASKRHTGKKQNTRYANPSANTNLRRVKGCEPTVSPGGQEEEEAHAYSQRVEGGITTNKARPVSTFLNCTRRWDIHMIDIENARGILIMFVVYGGW